MHSVIFGTVCSTVLATVISSTAWAESVFKAVTTTEILITEISFSSASDSDIDPYTLCEDWPLNSVCQPYHSNPVALEDRPGEVALGCVLTADNAELQGACKYTIGSDKVIAYIEEGQDLASLNDRKPTRVVDIPTTNIAKLAYEEDTAENRRSLLELLPPIRIVTRIFSQPEEISLISVVFLSTADAEPSVNEADTELSATVESDPVSAPGEITADETAATEQPSLQQSLPVVLTLVVNREQGADVRSQLETSTGLPSEAPPAES